MHKYYKIVFPNFHPTEINANFIGTEYNFFLRHMKFIFGLKLIFFKFIYYIILIYFSRVGPLSAVGVGALCLQMDIIMIISRERQNFKAQI
jgi:hypothetical protein